MKKYSRIGDRAADAGDLLRRLGPRVQSIVGTGAGLGIAKTAGKIGLKVARKNPVIAAASIAGAGLLWYAAKKRAQKAEQEGATIEGSAQRVDARRTTAGDDGHAGGPTAPKRRGVRTDRGEASDTIFEAGVMHRDERFADRPYTHSTVHFDPDVDRPAQPDVAPPPYDAPRYRG